MVFLGSKLTINFQSLPYAVTKPRFCHFESLSIRRAIDGDLLARGYGHRR
jgi:hypothetical protein